MAAQAFRECTVVDTNQKKSVPQFRVTVQNAINTVMGRIDRESDNVDLWSMVQLWRSTGK